MIKRIYEPETGVWQLDENKFTNGKLPEFNNCGNDEFVKILCESKETAKVLIENIEKSVAKEPIVQRETDEYISEYFCPCCDYMLRWTGTFFKDTTIKTYKYCPKCGQKIDWRELEE